MNHIEGNLRRSVVRGNSHLDQGFAFLMEHIGLIEAMREYGIDARERIGAEATDALVKAMCAHLILCHSVKAGERLIDDAANAGGEPD